MYGSLAGDLTIIVKVNSLGSQKIRCMKLISAFDRFKQITEIKCYHRKDVKEAITNVKLRTSAEQERGRADLSGQLSEQCYSKVYIKY